jgi:hypothetical protein
MRLRLTAPAIALGLACAALPAVAGTAGTPVKVAFVGAHQVRGDLGAATGAPTAWAAAALRAQSSRLGIHAGAFRFESTRQSLVGTHVRGRQFIGGVPVEGTDVLVSAVGGRVVQVDADASPLQGSPAVRPVPVGTATAAALGHLGVTKLFAPAAVTRVLAVRGGRLVDTYLVSVVAASPGVHGTVVVDAATGAVLGTRDLAKYEGKGKALIFDPNPIQHTRNPALREPGPDLSSDGLYDADLDSPALTAARSWVPFGHVDTTALLTTQLKGTWVNVLGMAGFVSKTPLGDVSFDYTRSQPQFEGVMAYAHLDRYQSYLQGLGFKGSKGVNAEQQDIVVTRVETYDNSFYQPGADVMLLGAGGVDDGEDAEVILHEYGHAMQDDQVPGFGATHEGASMGEGFGDFNAGNFFARTSRGGYYDVCLMEWDSTSYSRSNPTCIRRMDSKKHYPQDLDRPKDGSEGDVHADGEMWSTFLWNVRSHLPGSAVQKSDAAARLVVTSHEFQTPSTRFAGAVASLRTAAKALKHPEYVRFIDAEAKRTGFPLNP